MIKTLILTTSLIFLVGCGQDNIKNSTSSEQTRINNDYTNTHAYLPNSPYASVLKECALIADEKDSCTLAKLPLLGQKSFNITKEMILNRLLVSHQWMGDRFSQMLDRYSNKMIQQLFRATTAIVIDDDIVPAYYWAVTGAIYLDPSYIWMSQAEKDTITKKEDHRSGYGSALLFVEGTSYRYNGQSLYTQDKTSRNGRDVELSLAGLLYHELTHANDFMPPARLSSLDNSKSVLDNMIAIGGNRTSEQLYSHSPAESSRLASMGKVLYQGVTPTAEQRQISSIEMGNMFNDDVTDAMYAYSTRYEDTAMLMQSAMMKYFYQVDSLQLFLNAKDYDNKKYTLEWGIKNPVLKSRVIERAIFVANRVLPIDGGWSDNLHSIPDNAALLATSPKNANAYMGSSIYINPDELRFNKKHTLTNF